MNYQVIYDVDPEQLKSKEDIEKEYHGLDPDDVKRIQESKKQNWLLSIQRQNKEAEAKKN